MPSSSNCGMDASQICSTFEFGDWLPMFISRRTSTTHSSPTMRNVSSLDTQMDIKIGSSIIPLSSTPLSLRGLILMNDTLLLCILIWFIIVRLAMVLWRYHTLTQLLTLAMILLITIHPLFCRFYILGGCQILMWTRIKTLHLCQPYQKLSHLHLSLLWAPLELVLVYHKGHNNDLKNGGNWVLPSL